MLVGLLHSNRSVYLLEDALELVHYFPENIDKNALMERLIFKKFLLAFFLIRGNPLLEYLNKVEGLAAGLRIVPVIVIEVSFHSTFAPICSMTSAN